MAIPWKGFEDVFGAQLKQSLTVRRRFLAWVKANPLRFMFSREGYRETVQLVLSQGSHPTLGMDVVPDVRRLPLEGGILVATAHEARAEIVFKAATDEQGRISGFELPQSQWRPESTKKLVHVRSMLTLLVPREGEAEGPGLAGWRVLIHGASSARRSG